MQPINYLCIVNDGIKKNLHTKYMKSCLMQDIVYNTM